MSENSNLTIVPADDHPVFRHGLRQIIETESDFEVLGEARDGRRALEMIQELQPRFAIPDISMPILDGLAVAHSLQKEAHR